MKKDLFTVEEFLIDHHEQLQIIAFLEMIN